jgi:hypothetical protein
LPGSLKYTGFAGCGRVNRSKLLKMKVVQKLSLIQVRKKLTLYRKYITLNNKV